MMAWLYFYAEKIRRLSHLKGRRRDNIPNPICWVKP